tara:strand:- start:2102 stop:2344 length:243 start_codon:yes stop_codon:yes gene_type:complete
MLLQTGEEIRSLLEDQIIIGKEEKLVNIEQMGHLFHMLSQMVTIYLLKNLLIIAQSMKDCCEKEKTDNPLLNKGAITWPL